jgi:hypothetical protein
MLDAVCTGPLDWFRDCPNPRVPLVAAGVYTVWDGETFICAGMAGRSLTAEQIQAGIAASAPMQRADEAATSSTSTERIDSGCAVGSRMICHAS